MEDIFLARQPIYNDQLNVVGYELLFRDRVTDAADFTDATTASSKLIINTFLGIGLEKVIGSSRAFINLSQDFFRDEIPVPMNPEQVVLEVCMEAAPEEEVLHGLQHLAEGGYVIALDDFVYRPGLEPLLKLAKIVKLDLSMHTEEQLREQIGQCRKHEVKLLAEKVETSNDLALCKELGFDYFQGFFLSHPETIRGRTAPTNRRILIQLLNNLEEADADIRDLEGVLVKDVALCYKLLRYIDCATYSQRCEINSIGDALKSLGTVMLKKWILLLLMSTPDNNQPQHLLTKAVLRARMCEMLAMKRNTVSPEQAFTTGLFSTLDGVMEMPMEDLFDTISLSNPIKFALLDREGELGQLLQQVLQHDAEISSAIDTGRLSAADFSSACAS